MDKLNEKTVVDKAVDGLCITLKIISNRSTGTVVDKTGIVENITVKI